MATRARLQKSVALVVNWTDATWQDGTGEARSMQDPDTNPWVDYRIAISKLAE